MFGVDEVLLWVFGVDVSGVRCLMFGVDGVLLWVLGVECSVLMECFCGC